MHLLRSSILCVVLLASTAGSALLAQEWGAQALALTPDGLRSPDGMWALHRTRDGLVLVDGAGTPHGAPLAIDTLAEAQWSPDSTAVALTSSDGGAVGTWSYRILRATRNDLLAVSDSRAVARVFRSRPGGCKDETPNVAVAGWVSVGTLLIIAEAPPHSSCRDMGQVRAYTVTREGAIRRRHSLEAVRRGYPQLLGARLLTKYLWAS